MNPHILPLGTPNAHLILGTCIRVGDYLMSITEYARLKKEDSRIAAK